jgi:exosortase
MSSIQADEGYFDEPPLDAQSARISWIVFGSLLALLVLAYGNMLSYTSTNWSKGLYSHGWIVPLFAGYLFWVRRQPLLECASWERWAGVGILGASLGLRLFASYYDFNNPERLSFITSLLGVCMLVGGIWLLKWAGPALAFLVFMFPLPSSIENSLLIKLQTYATMASTFLLQLMGIGAVREGNVITIDSLETPLTVAEACSGLRMLTIFVAMCVALFLLSERPWWDRLVILLSAIPIALASNVIRIVLTGLLYWLVPASQNEGLLHKMIHDFAGYGMMFIGMGLLWVELSLLRRITVPEDSEDFGAYGAVSG